MKEQLFIVSGASGAGKTVIVEALTAKGLGKRVITCTTRAPRTNNGVLEIDGVDYRFLAMDDFRAKLARGEFAEYADVYGKLYGTLKDDVTATMRDAGTAFLVVDVQGAATLMRVYPTATSVFIAVSREDMLQRLTNRGEQPDSIATRIADFDKETAAASLFHFLIQNKNDALLEAVSAMEEILAK